MEAPSDAEWIEHSLTRPAAFGAIFDRHAETLLRFLTRRVGADVGATLLGELFRIAFERRASFDLGRESARPWLYGIGANLLMHRGRSVAREARATRTVVHEAFLETPAPRVEAELVAEVDARLLLPQVAVALRLLPEGEREALMLFAWEDLAYEEIAEALEIPVGTVRSRIHRGRARLRELLGPNGKARNETPDAPAARETRS